MVCIAPKSGFFFRINSDSHWPVAVPIDAARHRFLDHDSFVECWAPLEFDDGAMDEAFAEGVLGRVRGGIVQAIWKAVEASDLIAPHDKQAIKNALQVR